MLNAHAAWEWLKNHRALVGVGLVLLLLDRASKVWALHVAAAHGPVKLGTYVWLSYVENTGAAFGMFQHANALLCAVMVAIIGYLIYSWKDLTQSGPWAQWGGMLILAGALGNLYDRLMLGFVVDMIDLRVWPVFNVADSCITVGAVLLGVCLLPRRAAAKETK